MPAVHPLVTAVQTSLGRLSVPASGIVVAVSGGPDSVALLIALLQIRPHNHDQPCVIAHLNHLLRAEESDADEAFVRDLHASLLAAGNTNILLEIDRLDVALDAKDSGDNLEAAARRLRYRWLAEVAVRHQLRHVATGHTADDQAETVLFRLLRGAGLQGLRGIAERRPLEPGVELIRPLLDVGHDDVLSFLESVGQGYRIDRSNEDRRLTRNRIRHELLPHLAEHYNPAIRDVLCRLARQAERAFELEAAEINALLAACEKPRAGVVMVFDHALLAAAPRDQTRQLFRRVWEREGWPMAQMGFEQWDRIASVVYDASTAIDLPGRIRVRRRDRVIQLCPGSELL